MTRMGFVYAYYFSINVISIYVSVTATALLVSSEVEFQQKINLQMKVLINRIAHKKGVTKPSD